MAKISANFYCHPDRDIHLIGITGTKGKTSVAILTRRLLDDNGIPAGYIGTNGVQYAGRKEETHNTTPEAPELYRYLSEMRDAGVRVATIEVSSQAILMQRVLGLTFRTCIFTNLSPDHIGPHEHPDFDNYRDCKRRLFHEFGAETVIVNRDDLHDKGVWGTHPHGLRRAGRRLFRRGFLASPGRFLDGDPVLRAGKERSHDRISDSVSRQVQHVQRHDRRRCGRTVRHLSRGMRKGACDRFHSRSL